MPRETVIPVLGTSANLMVSFGCAHIASDRSSPTLSTVTSNGSSDLDVADVVAAEVHVHQPRDELVVRGVLVDSTPCRSELAQFPTLTSATRTLSPETRALPFRLPFCLPSDQTCGGTSPSGFPP